MKKKRLKQHPLRLAGERETAYKADTEDLQIVVPELMEMPDGKVLVLNVYDRAELCKGILKPQYRIFQTEDDYLTESVRDGKWRTASWNYITARCSFGRYFYVQKLADPKDGDMITQYFGAGAETDPIKLVHKKQDAIRRRNLEIRHRRIMQEIDTVMEKVPPCDGDFLRWAEEEGLYWSRYIFYKYTRRKNLKGICTHCGQEVTLEKGEPRHNQKGACPLCHSPVIYIAEGRKPRHMVHWGTVSKLDKVDGRILYREFELCKSYRSVRPEDWKFRCRETARVFFDSQGNCEIYRMGYFSFYGPYRWCRRKHLPQQGGIFYTKGLRELLSDTAYRYSALDVYAERHPREMMFPLNYLAVYAEYPALEYLTKLGMSKMVKELMGVPSCARYLKPGTRLQEVLEITTPQELELARHDLLNLSDFKNAQKLLKEGIELTSQEMANYMDIYGSASFAKYNGLIPVRKLASYLARQVEKEGQKPGCKLDQNLSGMDADTRKAHREMVSLWEDYIRFCGELDYELSALHVLCPPDLKKEHDRVYGEYQIMQDKKRKAEQRRKERRLKSIFRQEQSVLSGKIKNKEYELFVPKSAPDLRREGQVLGHCVGSYVDAILAGRCLIYFIRKRTEPEMPFYTVEWKNNGIYQCRGNGNCGYGKDVGRFVKYAERKLKRIKGEAAKAA